MIECAPIELPLSLSPCPQTADAADSLPMAWLIPGDAALWLAEVSSWGVPLDDLRLLVIPRAASDPRPAGVLVFRASEAGGGAPTTSPMALPFIRLADRLFIPAYWRLRPAVSDEELKAWCVWDVQVLHPTIGMIGCASSELLRIADLLSARPPQSVDWSRAHPGAAVEAQVRSVRPASPPELGQFLTESGDDIGESAPDALPPLPEESALSKAAARGSLAGLAMLQWIARQIPGPAPAPIPRSAGGKARDGFIQRVQRWITTKQEAWRAGLENARQRELARLMRMLQTQPDVGLRFALPLTGGDSHRGLAPPGERLTRRDTSFNLGSLFSSNPADPWELDWQLRQRLTAKYHELASRELALRRYRRAAYVFAELLGDLNSAANALKQGRFFREAAALYRDRLNNSTAAAACLESGGLLEEAAEIYLSLKQYEKAGDLYRRLGRDDDADNAFRAEIAELRSRRDIVAAARILDLKLHATEEAIDLLWCEWPDGPQATVALHDYFALLWRAARHDEVARRVTALARETTAASQVKALTVVLSEMASAHPSDSIRAIAQDAVRLLVGRRLGEMTIERDGLSEIRQLISFVTSATPADRLLARDGVRYVDSLPTPSPRPALPRISSRRPLFRRDSQKIELLHAFALGTGARWRKAIARGGTLYAQGVNEDGAVVIARALWSQQSQHAVIGRAGSDAPAYRLEVGPIDHASGDVDRNLLAIPLLRRSDGHRRLAAKLPRHGPFFGALTVSTPPFLPTGRIFDACVDESGRLWVAQESPSAPTIMVSVFTGGGNLESTFDVDLPVPSQEGATIVAIATAGAATCIACDAALLILPHAAGASQRRLELARPAIQMISSPPHTRPRVGIGFADGACICWPPEGHIAPFGTDQIDPVLGLTRDGLFISASRQRIAAHQTDGLDVRLVGSVNARGEVPIGVTPAPNEGGFAVIFEDGLVQVMKCTAS